LFQPQTARLGVEAPWRNSRSDRVDPTRGNACRLLALFTAKNRQQKHASS